MTQEQISEFDSEQAAKALLWAEDESEVLNILSNPFFEKNGWEPLGGNPNENNYPTVKNQAGHPMAALTEIIVNAQDAILLKEYRQQYGEDGPEFATAHEAADSLFDGDFGEEPLISLRADGDRPRHDDGDSLNLTVIDRGCGQAPGDFEDNFLGLFKPGRVKQQYSFLHGQYGMGSTAVLPFCGDRSFKLIVSSGVNQTGVWSWTIIKKNRDEASFQYLTLDGEIPTFEGEIDEMDYGSFVKMYDYDTEVKSNITTNLRTYLERYLLNTPIPVYLEETRYEEALVNVTTRGLLPHIQESSEYVQEEFSITHNFEDNRLGARDFHVIVFKDNAVLEESDQLSKRQKSPFVGRKYHTNHYAIFHNVDGQTHAGHNRGFLTNRCDLHRVGEDAIVYTEFSDLGLVDTTDLFKPSRDGTRDPLGPIVESGLEEALSDEQGRLKEIERQRRQEDAKQERNETVVNTLEELVGENPHLVDYFEQGTRLKMPTVNEDEKSTTKDIDRDLKFIPEEFEVVEKEKKNGELVLFEGDGESYVKEIAEDGSGVVKFKLDAENDYFTRQDRPGNLTITPSDMVANWSLAEGVLRVRMEPLPAQTIGSSIPIEARVERPDHEDLTQRFNIDCVEPRDGQNDTNGDGKGENGEDLREAIGLPEHYRVEKDDWGERNGEEGWDEHDIIEMFDYDDGMQIYINMDSAPLQNFLAAQNFHDPGEETVKDLYEAAIVLFSVCQFVELDKVRKDPEKDITRLIETSMKGLCQALLPQIISDDRLEELTVK